MYQYQHEHTPRISEDKYPIFRTKDGLYELGDPCQNKYEYQTMGVRRFGTKRFVNLLNIKSLTISKKLEMFEYACKVYQYSYRLFKD